MDVTTFINYVFAVAAFCVLIEIAVQIHYANRKLQLIAELHKL